MTFLHAGIALAGLACVAIPILIHLLSRQRRKPIVWGAMRFLLEAYRKQRRRLQLEQLLLLAARCLLILLLGAAIARPLLERAGVFAGGAGTRSVYIVIDNALASGVRDADETRTALDRHKASAAALLDALAPGDRAALITLGAPAQTIVLPPSPDIGAVRALIERIEPTDAAADTPGALRRIGEEIGRADSSDDALVVILSDFLAGSADLNQPLPRALESAAADGRLRILAAEPATIARTNVQVTALEPLRPIILTGAPGPDGRTTLTGASEQVRVQLRRTGPGVAERAVTTVRVGVTHARAGGAPVQAARVEVRWAPGQSEATAGVVVDGALLTLEAGAHAALIAEIDQDALPGDNVHRRPVQVRDALRIGLVDRRRLGGPARIDRMTGGEWVRLALRPGAATPMEMIDVLPGALDAATLASLDALVITRPDLLDDDGWARVGRFAHAGGLVLVAPPAEASVHLWSDAMSRELGLGWRIAREPTTFDTPARLADEQPRSGALALLHAELGELVRPVNIHRALPVDEHPPGASVLLALNDGAAWMLAAAPGSGEEPAEPGAGSNSMGGSGATSGGGLVVYLASALALDWTDLPAKPLMVPLMQEIARQGVGEAAGAWSQTAGATIAAPQRAADLTGVQGHVENLALRVDASGRTPDPVRRSGLFLARDDAGASRGLVAVNPDTRAGRTDAQTAPEVMGWLNQTLGAALSNTNSVRWLDTDAPAAALGADDRRASISLPLLIAALLVALAETVMARFFSHARAEDVPGPRTAGRAAA
ncbi:MAG: VWA domain-containing protein [Phycisphaerales bacterium]|nr:MAG: VWA domain-containing protein [Phycisphaerales bacterium]